MHTKERRSIFNSEEIRAVQRVHMYNTVLFRYLDLSYNSLETIDSAAFGKMPTLLELDMSHNQLKRYLPCSLTLCKGLPVLWAYKEMNLCAKHLQFGIRIPTTIIVLGSFQD
jgi:hypothetical protein